MTYNEKKAMKNKFLCVHGHFYQPPRENPWTGEVEPEESAHPYRDWNARIFEECYGPNARAPVVDDAGRVEAMADNYRRISFNFGATLLSWLERRRPAFYLAVLQADAESARERGFGNALAQPYIHAILPLQSLRDKRTLVRWGIEDFRLRYGRRPDGMWLPETGVDEETLEVLIDEGVRFTILSPNQAARVRTIGEEPWKEVRRDTLLPTRPYRWNSRQSPGESIALFFFHEGLHKFIVSGEAFEKPDNLIRKILARYHPDDSHQLVNVAVDGEFFGHHHRPGAALLGETLRAADGAGLTVTNYAAYLAQFPPPQEVEIKPKTAWSCEHGLGRWTEDCGCRSAHLPSWKQAWRGPLRAALDGLAASVDALYESKAGDVFVDYWRARDRYARRLFAGDPTRFLAAETRRPLSPEERCDALALLELQRQRLAMFTSCGWFFDDVSGLEACVSLKSAARAVELARRFGAELEPALLEALAKAPSNLDAFKDGAGAYEKLVKPLAIELTRACAHFALLDHLGAPAEPTPRFSVELLEGETLARAGLAGRDRALTLRRVKVVDRETLEQLDVRCAVLRRDRLDVSCRVTAAAPDVDGIKALFASGCSDDELVSALDAAYGSGHFGLEALFSEDRRQALRLLTPSPIQTRQRREFLERWRKAVHARADDEILELLSGCRALKLSPDQLPWIERVRETLHERLEALLPGADGAKLAAAARWIEAFEACGLHASVWRLQELFWRWRAALASREALPGEREAAAALGEKLDFAERVLPLDPRTPA